MDAGLLAALVAGGVALLVSIVGGLVQYRTGKLSATDEIASAYSLLTKEYRQRYEELEQKFTQKFDEQAAEIKELRQEIERWKTEFTLERTKRENAALEIRRLESFIVGLQDEQERLKLETDAELKELHRVITKQREEIKHLEQKIERLLDENHKMKLENGMLKEKLKEIGGLS